MNDALNNYILGLDASEDIDNLLNQVEEVINEELTIPEFDS